MMNQANEIEEIQLGEPEVFVGKDVLELLSSSAGSPQDVEDLERANEHRHERGAEQRRLRLSWGTELRSLQQQLAECLLRLESEAAGERARLAAVVAERSALEAELAEEQRRHREAVEG